MKNKKTVGPIAQEEEGPVTQDMAEYLLCLGFYKQWHTPGASGSKG